MITHTKVHKVIPLSALIVIRFGCLICKLKNLKKKKNVYDLTNIGLSGGKGVKEGIQLGI